MSKYQDFLSSLGLKVNGNDATGYISDYPVIAKIIPTSQYPMIIEFVTYLSDEEKESIINSLKSNYKNLQADSTLFGIVVGITGISYKKLFDNVNNVIISITQELSNHNALNKDYCPLCGEELLDEGTSCVVDNYTYIIHSHCKEELKLSVNEANQAYIEAPNNILKGLLGALVGAVAAVVVFEILYWLGFFSALSSFVGIALGTFLYKKFGGKPTILMVVLVSLITITFVIGDLVFIYVRAANELVKSTELSDLYINIKSTGFQCFLDCMKVKEFSRSFISDLIMNILFCFIGAIYEIITMVKAVKGIKQKIE